MAALTAAKTANTNAMTRNASLAQPRWRYSLRAGTAQDEQDRDRKLEERSEIRQDWFEHSNNCHEREQQRGGRNQDQYGEHDSRPPRAAANPAMSSPATMSCATPATDEGARTERRCQ